MVRWISSINSISNIPLFDAYDISCVSSCLDQARATKQMKALGSSVLVFSKDRGTYPSRGLLFSTVLPPLKHSRKFKVIPTKIKTLQRIQKNIKTIRKKSSNIRNNSQTFKKLLSKN